MLYKQSELFYWDKTVSPARWVQALTHSLVNAVIDVGISEGMGNPRKIAVTLSNVPKDFTSSNATDQTGALSAVFTDYQSVLLRDGETHQITFAGRIYKIEKKFNPSYGGNTVYLECFDALAELRDYPTKALKNTSSDEWDRYELSGKKRSVVIEELINYGLGQGRQDGSSNYFLADPTQNLNSTDKGSDVRFRFQESAVTIPAQSDEAKKEWFRPKRGWSSILEAIAELADGTMTAFSALTQIMRLHQITCGHVTTDDGKVKELKSKMKKKRDSGYGENKDNIKEPSDPDIVLFGLIFVSLGPENNLPNS